MSNIGPQLPPHLLASAEAISEDCDSICPRLPNKSNEEDGNANVKSYGPALPPGFSSNSVDKSSSNSNDVVRIGPSFPKNYRKGEGNDGDSDAEDDDSDTDIVGPRLPFQCSEEEEERSELIKEEFESRAKAMKNKLTGNSSVEDTNIQRESWMLELPPEVGKNFGLGPRTFRAKPTDLGDRSVWTDTPADRERKRKEAREEKKQEPAVKKTRVPTSEELEMRDRVHEYNQKTRPQSLLDMHREKFKKEETGVRQPFDRDKDLALHRRNPKEKAKFIESAKQMNTKFSTGSFEDKFL